MRNIKSECKSEFETAQASMPEIEASDVQESPYLKRRKTPWDDPGCKAVVRHRLQAQQEAAAAAVAEVRNEYFAASAAARQQLEQQQPEHELTRSASALLWPN